MHSSPIGPSETICQIYVVHTNLLYKITKHDVALRQNTSQNSSLIEGKWWELSVFLQFSSNRNFWFHGVDYFSSQSLKDEAQWHWGCSFFSFTTKAFLSKENASSPSFYSSFYFSFYSSVKRHTTYLSKGRCSQLSAFALIYGTVAEDEP